jgi:hypothetical protein
LGAFLLPFRRFIWLLLLVPPGMYPVGRRS